MYEHPKKATIIQYIIDMLEGDNPPTTQEQIVALLKEPPPSSTLKNPKRESVTITQATVSNYLKALNYIKTTSGYVKQETHDINDFKNALNTILDGIEPLSYSKNLKQRRLTIYIDIRLENAIAELFYTAYSDDILYINAYIGAVYIKAKSDSAYKRIVRIISNYGTLKRKE